MDEKMYEGDREHGARRWKGREIKRRRESDGAEMSNPSFSSHIVYSMKN